MKKEYTLIWRKVDGTIIEDIVLYAKEWLKVWPYGNITIGCDSQEHSRYIKYSVTLNMHMIDETGQGKGGHVVLANVIDKDKNMKSDIFTKLWAEAELILQTVKQFQEANFSSKLIVHLDYNSEASELSNMLYSAGTGLFKGMNLEVHGKPHAWASSHSADAFCKNKHGRKVTSTEVKTS